MWKGMLVRIEHIQALISCETYACHAVTPALPPAHAHNTQQMCCAEINTSASNYAKACMHCRTLDKPIQLVKIVNTMYATNLTLYNNNKKHWDHR